MLGQGGGRRENGIALGKYTTKCKMTNLECCWYKSLF